MLNKILSTSLAIMSLASAQSQETILGVYMFHRHGDRTAKSTPPSNLTDLGYAEVYASGQYYRSRYIASDAAYKVNGINIDLVKQSQIAVSAPADTVLMNSATGFLQGLYPPVGDNLGSNTLRNGSTVTAPMQGYQLIPISLVSTGTNSEASSWLQAASGCAAATVSSNNYFSSAQYTSLLNSTQSFYQSILPVINGTFTSGADNFKNAYTIYDLINVAQIHNVTNYNNSQLITPEVFHQLATLADAHEWGLAYNASDDSRAIAGKVLAAQVVQFLNGTITSQGKQKLGVQFGAYGTFASFFGLAGLQNVDANFYGIADYASAMAFELFTNRSTAVTADDYPSASELFVRFIFHNGTTTSESLPTAYPLFGTGEQTISWNDFTNNMDTFSVGSTQAWCTACGNSTGVCAAYAPSGSNSSSSSSGSSSSTTGDAYLSGNGLSPAVNGVIGAMVTLAVILLLQTLFLVFGGYRLVSKKRLAADAASLSGFGGEKAQ